MGRRLTKEERAVVKANEEKEKERFWKIVDEFLMSEGKGTEIAAYFDIHPDTLYTRCLREKGVHWSAYQQMKKEKGDVILRKSQYQKAVFQNDCKMQIWLGRQRLGQTERTILQTEEVKTENQK